jgi:hypothetical protein
MPLITWNGNVSTAWMTAGNWDLNRIPGPLDDVLIASTFEASERYPDFTGIPTPPAAGSVINSLTTYAGDYTDGDGNGALFGSNLHVLGNVAFAGMVYLGRIGFNQVDGSITIPNGVFYSGDYYGNVGGNLRQGSYGYQCLSGGTFHGCTFTPTLYDTQNIATGWADESSPTFIDCTFMGFVYDYGGSFVGEITMYGLANYGAPSGDYSACTKLIFNAFGDPGVATNSYPPGVLIECQNNVSLMNWGQGGTIPRLIWRSNGQILQVGGGNINIARLDAWTNVTLAVENTWQPCFVNVTKLYPMARGVQVVTIPQGDYWFAGNINVDLSMLPAGGGPQMPPGVC